MDRDRRLRKLEMSAQPNTFFLLHRARVARSRGAWREAARLVSIRWGVFLTAEAQTREFAFASYLAALNAEETAAAELAKHLTPALADGTSR
jgi:hypothetical protein